VNQAEMQSRLADLNDASAAYKAKAAATESALLAERVAA